MVSAFAILGTTKGAARTWRLARKSILASNITHCQIPSLLPLCHLVPSHHLSQTLPPPHHVSRAETVTVAALHMSPDSRLPSQRRTPLQRLRHLESAPKPQVVDDSARDPGKGHAPQVRMAERPPRDPEKRHATRVHESTPEIAWDRGKKHVTQARDLSRDQTGPQQSRDPTRSRDQLRSRDQTRSSN